MARGAALPRDFVSLGGRWAETEHHLRDRWRARSPKGSPSRLSATCPRCGLEGGVQLRRFELDELDRPIVLRCTDRSCGASTELCAPLWGLPWLAPEHEKPAGVLDLWEPDMETAGTTADAVTFAEAVWTEEQLNPPWMGGAELPDIVEDGAAWWRIEGRDPVTGRRPKAQDDPRSATVRACGVGFYAGVGERSGTSEARGRSWCRTPSSCRRCAAWATRSHAVRLRRLLNQYPAVHALVMPDLAGPRLRKALSRAQRTVEGFGAAVVRQPTGIHVLSTHPIGTRGAESTTMSAEDALRWFVTHAMVTPYFAGQKWLRGAWRQAGQRATKPGTLYAGRFGSEAGIFEAERIARDEDPELRPTELARRMIGLSYERAPGGHSPSPSTERDGEGE